MELSMQDLKELIGSDNRKSNSSGLDNTMNEKYCIVRTYSAGVHCGNILQHEGQQALLENVRRIWSWSGAFTLNKIATDGFESAKMSVAIDVILLTNVIEIIPVNKNIAGKLKAWAVHND